MSLTFSPYGVIVSDSAVSSFYGECKYMGGSTEPEIYEVSFPNSNGVLEFESGDKRGMYSFRVMWYTNDPDTVDSTIDTILREKLYGSITFSDGVGGTSSRTFVRLLSANDSGERVSGYRDGDDIMCIAKILTFKKVRF